MRKALIVVLVALAVGAGLLVAAGFYVARDPEYHCLVDVIARSAVSPSDTITSVESRLSVLPLGTECTFVSDTGARFVVEPEWSSTVLALVAAASATAAILVAASMPGQRSSRR